MPSPGFPLLFYFQTFDEFKIYLIRFQMYQELADIFQKRISLFGEKAAF